MFICTFVKDLKSTKMEESISDWINRRKVTPLSNKKIIYRFELGESIDNRRDNHLRYIKRVYLVSFSVLSIFHIILLLYLNR